MKETGWILATIGVVIAIGALFLSSTAEVTMAALSEFGSARTEEVHNLGLLQRRELVFIAGCTLFLAGILLGTAGAVIEALRPPGATAQTAPIAAPPAALQDEKPVIQYAAPADDPDDRRVGIALGAFLLIVAIGMIVMAMVTGVGGPR